MNQDRENELNKANNHTILVVDDTAANLLVISDCLKSFGFKILVAQDGASALEKAKYSMPDLIMLDVMMPGIDGFETCRRIKADNSFKDIPVIFMTSLNDTENKVKGFKMGGVDYITKPYQIEEVAARVTTHLKIQEQKNILQSQKQEMALYNEQLNKEINIRKQVEQELSALNEELIAINGEMEDTNNELNKEVDERRRVENKLAKTNEELTFTIQELKTMQAFLIQSEKMAALGNLVAGIAHEINTPIGVGVTASSHLSEITDDLIKLSQNKTLFNENMMEYLQDIKETSAIIQKNLERAGKLIFSFKQVSVDQSSSVNRKFNVKKYLEEIILSIQPQLRKTKHSVLVECDSTIDFDGSPGALSQIVTNLVMNSVNHAFRPEDNGEIKIIVTKDKDNIRITFSDNGIGMKEEVLARIFDPFYTTKRSSGGTGLGLYIVYNIVNQQFGGNIECISEPGKGAMFKICFPQKKEIER